jgi:vacuolar-type H+-ATPase subunit D/Vma8
MSHDEFTKLFKYVEQMRSEMNKRFDEAASKADVEAILKGLDSIEKLLEISDDERLVMGHQLDRLNRWVQELANKIGYQLSI